ncbi:MAG: MFS transporter [Alicyclobacillus macrosporangiidus]|uniref:MFS transporter n=1 Tax=Alicyclobacillus macrosporangiidus TaxID=392015 RepID=UPI0026F1B707|nr:MFS transporter [Alicyclobacillus macrosporangiidus]MCL6598381.1 MFS transporter [Alicyclobacillus macrosporangiidus]
MATWTQQAVDRLKGWLEPELFQPFLLGVFISLSLSEFVRGALTFSLLPTWGRTVLGFAMEWTALALSVHYLVDNALRAPAGWLVDHVGQRPAILAGFTIALGSLLAMSQVHTVGALILCMAAYGVGATPMWPSVVSAIGRATPESKRAAFMSYMYMFWLGGTGLGPVMINFLTGRRDALAFFVLAGVLALALVLAWVLVRPPAGRSAGKGQPAHAASVRGPALSTGSPSAPPGGWRAAADRRYWRSLWRNVREVAFLFPGMFVQTFAVASLVPILSVYARVVLGISGARYSSILVAGGALTVALLIPAGRLVDRIGPRPFLVGGFLVAGGLLAVYPWFHTLPLTYATVAVLGVCYAFILPAWNAVLDHSIDPDKKGALWGVFMTVEGLGSAAGPYAGGLMWDVFNPNAPFLVSAAVILIMGVLYLFLPITAVQARRRARTPAEAGGSTAGAPTGAAGARILRHAGWRRAGHPRP